MPSSGASPRPSALRSIRRRRSACSAEPAMSGPNLSGPWGRTEPAPTSTAPAPAAAPHEKVTAARVNGTDFLAAQRDNRIKTWVLILALINIGFLLGYVLGWAVEAWS